MENSTSLCARVMAVFTFELFGVLLQIYLLALFSLQKEILQVFVNSG